MGKELMCHLYGRNLEKIIENSKGRICEFHNLENGKYIVSKYEIFKGVTVFYNDIHTSVIKKKLSKNLNQSYEINHCREGRFECVLSDGTITYMESGDFAINASSNSSKESFFPISHYQGVTFYINPNEFDSEIYFLEEMLGIKFEVVLRKLCNKDKVFVQRATRHIEHIFYEVYKVPDEILIEYLRVKFQELFLYISSLDTSNKISDRKYFIKTNVDIVKKIDEFIKNNYEKNITYDKLSEIFKINSTTMKSCYKSVFGQTIKEAITSKRLEVAADFLNNTSISITEIAIRVGFTDHAKFSNTFKNKFNLTPSEYRKISKTAHLV